ARAVFGADVVLGPYVYDDVYAFRSVAVARRFVSSTKRAVSACPAMSIRHKDTGIEDVSKYRVQPPASNYDVALTYTVASRTIDGKHVDETTRDVAYLRRGTVVSIVTRSADIRDRAAFEELEQSAQRRMAAAAGSLLPTNTAPGSPDSSRCAPILDPPG